MTNSERMSRMQSLDKTEEALLSSARTVAEFEANIKNDSRVFRWARHFSHRIETATGTEDGNEKPARILTTIGVMGAGAIAGGPLGVATGLGGGVFAGESFNPVSRWLKPNHEKFLERYCGSDQIIPDRELIKFFSSFPDVLTKEEIRDWLNGQRPKPGQKEFDDPRYQVIDKLAKDHARHFEEIATGKPEARLGPRKQKGRQKTETIISVTGQIFDSQRIALRLRSRRFKLNVRKEAFAKFADDAAGLLTIAAAMGIVSLVKGDIPVQLLGILDDIPPLAGPVSIILKEYAAKQKRKQKYERSSCSDSPQLSAEMHGEPIVSIPSTVRRRFNSRR